MKAFYITSSRPGEGKSAIIAGLSSYFQKQAKKIGYIKPVALKAGPSDEGDMDELFFKYLLKLEDKLESLSPLFLTPEKIKGLSQQADIPASILDAFKAVSANRDIVFVEGLSGLSSSQPEGVIGARIASKIGAQVIAVAGYTEGKAEETLKQTWENFGKNLLGVIFNSMSPGQIEAFKETRLSSLKASGYPVLGLLPRDRALATVTLGELVKLLGANPVNEHDGLDHLVENVMVGSHGIDPGVYYYGQREKKVVVLRSDRPDMQLAALRTPTLALILAGERHTYDEVLFHAEQNKIPIFSLPGKTLEAVEKMGDILKPTPFRQVRKVERIEQLLRENIELRGILA